MKLTESVRMTQNRHYCGSPGLTIRGLFRVSNPDLLWRHADGRSSYFTHKGRCGLGLLCRQWGLGPNDEILMPAYNCGTEVDPFLHYGLEMQFYRIDRKACIDTEDLMGRITSKTRVIYVTHYFGWPQEIGSLAEHCREKGIYLVEDCALSLFSNPVDHPFGMLGDGAIYSFPKTLPVPDGGALTTSESLELSNMAAESPPAKATFREMLPLFKRAALRTSDKSGVYSLLPGSITQGRKNGGGEKRTTPTGFPEIPQSYYYNKAIENMRASAVTRFVVRRTDPEGVVRTRRDNYSRLHEVVKDSGLLKPLFEDLPEGLCPLCLPVLVEDREAVFRELDERGIAAVRWWSGFHRRFDWAEFPDAHYLKEHLLAIPVHQQLTKKQVEYMAGVLENIG